MEAYQAVGIGVMVAMGFVVHSTVRLNALRKARKVERHMINVRDWFVLIRPADFDAEEVQWVRTSWIACAALMGLLLLLFALAPDDMLHRFEGADGAPSSSNLSPAGQSKT